MARTSATKTDLFPVSLKSINPAIPVSDHAKIQLVEDLEKMDCEGLILQPWSIKNEALV